MSCLRMPKCKLYLCEYAVVHHGPVQARLHEGQGAYEAEVDEQTLYQVEIFGGDRELFVQFNST